MIPVPLALLLLAASPSPAPSGSSAAPPSPAALARDYAEALAGEDYERAWGLLDPASQRAIAPDIFAADPIQHVGHTPAAFRPAIRVAVLSTSGGAAHVAIEHPDFDSFRRSLEGPGGPPPMAELDWRYVAKWHDHAPPMVREERSFRIAQAAGRWAVVLDVDAQRLAMLRAAADDATAAYYNSAGGPDDARRRLLAQARDALRRFLAASPDDMVAKAELEALDAQAGAPASRRSR